MPIKHPYILAIILVFGLNSLTAQDTFQLAPPYLRYASVFFEKSVSVTLDFAQAGAQIHYTTNGREPSKRDPVYTHPIRLKKHQTTLKARVYGAGFLPSEVVEATFYKKGLTIDRIDPTLPREPYTGSGKTSLIDGLGGNPALHSRTWMGYRPDEVTISLHLKKPKKVKKVLLHVLEDQGAWIFQPQKISVCYRLDNAWMLIGSKTFVGEVEKASKASCQAILVDTKHLKIKTSDLLVIIYPLEKMPAWHPGKGEPAWLFIDEVNVY